MVGIKRREITETVNYPGEERWTLTIDQVQKKWPDNKCKSRTAVVEYNETKSATAWGERIT